MRKLRHRKSNLLQNIQLMCGRAAFEPQQDGFRALVYQTFSINLQRVNTLGFECTVVSFVATKLNSCSAKAAPDNAYMKACGHAPINWRSNLVLTLGQDRGSE